MLEDKSLVVMKRVDPLGSQEDYYGKQGWENKHVLRRWTQLR